MDLFYRLIPTAYDDDIAANTFIQCGVCGSWNDAAASDYACPYCGSPYGGDEYVQRGVYPPGFGYDEKRRGGPPIEI